MLPKIKLKFKGFLGSAETTNKAPYHEIARTPDMYPYGEDSYFITPTNEKDRERYEKGIKR